MLQSRAGERRVYTVCRMSTATLLKSSHTWGRLVMDTAKAIHQQCHAAHTSDHMLHIQRDVMHTTLLFTTATGTPNGTCFEAPPVCDALCGTQC